MRSIFTVQLKKLREVIAGGEASATEIDNGSSQAEPIGDCGGIDPAISSEKSLRREVTGAHSGQALLLSLGASATVYF